MKVVMSRAIFRRSIAFFLSVIATLFVGLHGLAADKQNASAGGMRKKIDGAYVQLDLGNQAMSDAYWEGIISDFRKLHFRHLIVQRVEFGADPQNYATGPARENYIAGMSKIIRLVNASNSAHPAESIDITAGLYMPDDKQLNYFLYAREKIEDELNFWTARNIALAKTIWALEGAKGCVKGWYVPTEPWNFDKNAVSAANPKFFGALHRHISESAAGVKAIAKLPVGMSVFANPWQDMQLVGKSVTEDLYGSDLLKNSGLSRLYIQDSYGAKLLTEPLGETCANGVGQKKRDVSPAEAVANEWEMIDAYVTAARINGIQPWLDLEAFVAKPDDPARNACDPTASPDFQSASAARFQEQLKKLQEKSKLFDGAVLFDYPQYVTKDKSESLHDLVEDWQK